MRILGWGRNNRKIFQVITFLGWERKIIKINKKLCQGKKNQDWGGKISQNPRIGKIICEYS